jgi:hypothetical protein
MGSAERPLSGMIYVPGIERPCRPTLARSPQFVNFCLTEGGLVVAYFLDQSQSVRPSLPPIWMIDIPSAMKKYNNKWTCVLFSLK